MWDALRAMTRLAHAGCREQLKVTVYNGRLFSSCRTPLAALHGLDDAGPASRGSHRHRIDTPEASDGWANTTLSPIVREAFWNN